MSFTLIWLFAATLFADCLLSIHKVRNLWKILRYIIFLSILFNKIKKLISHIIFLKKEHRKHQYISLWPYLVRNQIAASVVANETCLASQTFVKT